MVNTRHTTAQDGFSLVELVIVVALIGVLTVLAIPSYSDFIANQRARTSAQDLMGALVYARSEAIKANGNVTITAGAGGWADGWDIDVVNSGTRIRSRQALDGISIQEASGIAAITYDARGRIANAISFTVCDTHNRATQRNVQVSLSGRPSISMGGSCP